MRLDELIFDGARAVKARRRSFVVALAGLMVAIATASVRADFLIDPRGETDFGVDSGNDDDGSTTRGLGGSFTFYGTAETSVNVITNGFLAFAGNESLRLNRPIYNLAGLAGPVIAPLYNDLALVRPTSHISDLSVPGQYYVVSYQNIAASNNGNTPTPHALDPAFGDSFQVALFLGNTSVRGFNFLAGDIVISYGALNSSIVYEPEGYGVPGDATVGIGKDGSHYTGNPVSGDGFIADYSGLPTGSNFLLYRPDPNNPLSYSVTVASALWSRPPGCPPDPPASAGPALASASLTTFGPALDIAAPLTTPEPASLVSASIAIVIGVGYTRYRCTRTRVRIGDRPRSGDIGIPRT